MSYPLTLLSPARDKEVAYAAIQAGADAIYIGAPRFGARQAAGNSIEDLKQIIDYAHPYGVKVLVTLNTLLHEDEYADAVAMANELYQIGVDGLIIQDMHLLELDLPPIRLHASTQCDNRTPEDAIRAMEMGMKRIVLARELGIEEIRKIHEAVIQHAEETRQEPIELEAFVHGALCVSYSGRCFISEQLANRSANRGECAQFCRMQYDLLDGEGKEMTDDKGEVIHQRYLLSLQDMDRSAYIQELVDAGVTTFKIEGRLKDADYVTNITAYYRQQIDSLYPQEDGHRYQYDFTPNPQKTFHRGGTDYFLHGRTAHMANHFTPKSTGEEVGKISALYERSFRMDILPGITLHTGDGLSIGDQGCAINRIEGTTIVPNTMPHISTGQKVYRNLDNAFIKTLHAERRIPVEIIFQATEKGFCLQIGAWSKEFEYAHEAAKNEERALQTIREQISKLGETIYCAKEIRLETPAYFIPISVLNEWRREVIQLANAQEKKSLAGDCMRVKKEINHTRPNASEWPLMTCRYCLLHELGHCRKKNPMENEPKYLRLRNKTMLALHFDCKKCEMRVDKA